MTSSLLSHQAPNSPDVESGKVCPTASLSLVPVGSGLYNLFKFAPRDGVVVVDTVLDGSHSNKRLQEVLGL